MFVKWHDMSVSCLLDNERVTLVFMMKASVGDIKCQIDLPSSCSFWTAAAEIFA